MSLSGEKSIIDWDEEKAGVEDNTEVGETGGVKYLAESPLLHKFGKCMYSLFELSCFSNLGNVVSLKTTSLLWTIFFPTGSQSLKPN